MATVAHLQIKTYTVGMSQGGQDPYDLSMYPPLPSVKVLDQEDAPNSIEGTVGGPHYNLSGDRKPKARMCPVRNQGPYDQDGTLTGVITHHVSWTPGDMNTFLNNIDKPRHRPHLFASKDMEYSFKLYRKLSRYLSHNQRSGRSK